MLALLASACTGAPRPSLPTGASAYEVVPEGDVLQARDYLIGPLDELSISVFREPDLSVEKALVDSDGRVQVPLLGPVSASGLTASQFARAIEAGFAQRYLVDPRVSVAVVESSRRRVTVDGAVGKPGVYEMPGRISLIDAVALAQGLSQVAKSGEVAVIRRVGGQRVGGLFDLGAHVALQHVEQLRQFINRSAADEAADPGDPVIIAAGGTGAGMVAGFAAHRTELVDREEAVAAPGARLDEEHRGAVFQHDQQRHKQQ